MNSNHQNIEYAIETENLVKIYAGTKKSPPKTALNGINLKVKRGSFFALLGPNGAGKSTFINILADLVIKTDGTARIWGHDIDKARKAAKSSIGIVPQELTLDPFFTPAEMLDLHAGLYGVPKSQRRTMELLKAVGLEDKAHTWARRLSGGMRRRLMVAKAMVHAPPVLILDEPTAGVDIELRRDLWAYVKALNEQGTTILLTTHYLEEAEQLCDTIAIINHGELIACEPKEKMMKRLDCKEVLITVGDDVSSVPTSLNGYDVQIINPRQIRIQYRPSALNFGSLLQDLGKSQLTIQDMATKEADLEEIFVQMTSNKGKNAK